MAASCGLQQRPVASRLNASAEAAAGNAAAAARWAGLVDDEQKTKPGRRRRGAMSPAYDVFINHRGVDTKHNVARLLYDRLEHLSGGRVRSFLDNKSMRPGDRLGESIDEGIRQCKVAVAIFSKRYFDSEFCLHELASIVESRKVLIPIFYGIKPSELILPQEVADSKAHAPRDIERFRLALQEAKYTVGLTYDPATGDLAELVYTAADAVMERIQEMGQSMPQRQMIASRL
ncbi:probable 2' cyclic ADP-D-ribose synthase BdTIR [Setaria viridis]|nr:TIR domain-containing protein-like [Setaria viridis]